MTKSEQRLLTIIIVGTLSIVFLMRAVVQGVTSSARQPTGLVTLQTVSGDTVSVPEARVSDAPRPDPTVDGRWWMIAQAPGRRWERWDGPYLTAESCLNDVADSYASQYKTWQFTCAIDESDRSDRALLRVR